MINGSGEKTAVMVYKIIAAAAWAEAIKTGVFSGSADDLRDGFIHLSSAIQIPGTLAKHFAGRADLLVIGFDSVELGDLLKWERSRGGELFPHYYGHLPVKQAQFLKQLTLNPDGQAIVDDGTL